MSTALALVAPTPLEGTLSLLSFLWWFCPVHRRAIPDSLERGAGTRWRTRPGLGTSPSAAEPILHTFLLQPEALPTRNLWQGDPCAPFPCCDKPATAQGSAQGRTEVQRPCCKGAAEQQLCSAPILSPALARIICDSSLGSVHAADFPVAQWGLGRGRQTCCIAE